MPLGGRVGHGVHRVYTGRLHTAVGNRHVLVLQQRKQGRGGTRVKCGLICMIVFKFMICVRVFTYMPPEDPVQQAASGRLWWLIPVQIWRSRPLRPKHIQISETFSFYHLEERRGEEIW